MNRTESCFAVVFQELVRVHKCLLLEIQDSVHHRSAQNLYQIFITFKERCNMNLFPLYYSKVKYIKTLETITM